MEVISFSSLTMSTKLSTSVNVTVIPRNIETFTLQKLIEFLEMLKNRTQHTRRIILANIKALRKATKCINANPGNPEFVTAKKKLDVQMVHFRASLKVLVDYSVRVKYLVKKAKTDARTDARKARRTR